jgi:hypothetical protein
MRKKRCCAAYGESAARCAASSGWSKRSVTASKSSTRSQRRTALEQVGIRLLENHARHCVGGGQANVDELMAAVERFAKVR